MMDCISGMGGERGGATRNLFLWGEGWRDPPVTTKAIR